MGAVESNWITNINNLLATVNWLLDSILPWVVLALTVVYDIYYYIKNKRKRDVINQEIIWLVIQALLIALFWILPYLVFKNNLPAQEWFRWLVVGGVFMYAAHLYGHEHGEKRWFYSAIGHLSIILFGWVMGRWVGILFISLPLILIYYSALYVLAMIILPTSHPEDKDERWKRFLVLASYTWGIQFPILVVADHAWKEAETRIKGDFTRDFPIPGLIWTKSHHVVGITGGTQFKRVDGPGVMFTGKLEQPFQIIDLRVQIRSNKIDVVSKDGLHFTAIVFTAFRMDSESWDNKTHAQLRAANPLLHGANKPTYTIGSLPFSHRRIQAALGTTSVKTMEPDYVLPWDRWALNIVNEEARKVVSQKTLDEFWRPSNDKKGANAMSDIAQEIKRGIELILRSKGILLIVARIVNFEFSVNGKEKMDEISKQQIATWGSEWKRKRDQKLADAQAEAERNRQGARAYAESQLLNSIAEALQKTHDTHPKLHKHVIAMRYLNALQDFAHKNTPEEEEKIKELHDSFKGQ